MADHRELLALAARQQGVFTIAQARAAGVSDRSAGREVAAGRWRRLAPGVYTVAGLPPSPLTVLWAVQLARPAAVFSHATAAHLLGLAPPGPPTPHITVAPGTSGRSPLARVHRLELPTDLVTTVRGLRTTDATRTVVDCATVLGPRRAGALLDAAMTERACSPRRLDAVLRRSPHVPLRAKAVLLRQAEPWRATIRPGSVAEARLLRRIEEWGLPRPVPQIAIADTSGTVIARVDGGWPDLRLGIEYDSIRWHGPATWEHDELRHQRITALGWRILHVEAPDLRPGQRALRDRLVAEHRARSRC